MTNTLANRSKGYIGIWNDVLCSIGDIQISAELDLSPLIYAAPSLCRLIKK